MAAVAPEAAFGPPIPAKKIANVTGTVTSAASQVVPLARVPMISTTLPAMASPRCAANLSRLVPPNPAMTSVANPPNVANSAICGSPTTLSVIAKRVGMTSVARTARIAAGTDQTGFHQGCAMGQEPKEWSRSVASPLTVRLRSNLVPNAGRLCLVRAGQPYLAGQPAAWRVGEPDRAAVGGDEPVDDGEAEPGAVLAAGGVPQEGAGPLVRGHARAVVGDGQHDGRLRARDRHPDGATSLTDRFDGIVEQVVQDLL